MSMNFDQARINMVSRQVQPWDINDKRVLEVMTEVRREDFVPSRYRKLAFADMAIPLPQNQQMMRPLIEARLLQAIALREDETALEIGTGSGFLSACLAYLGKAVCSVDIYPELTEMATSALAARKVGNVECFTADALGGWLPEQAHDVVVVTGGVAEIPGIFKEWVNPGGRLFVIAGQAPAMRACLLTRTGVSDWQEEVLFETSLPLLVNAEPKAGFRFQE